MGLVVNIEHWPMAAAIALATEGVRASYNHGGGFGGGFGATDREIGSKLDGAKVLAVIECIGKKFKHLEDWMLFAYASPGWNDTRNRERFLTTALNDWVFAWLAKGVVVQERTGSKFRVILPLIASAFALEQASGAKVDNVNGDIYYSSAVKRESLISMLVDDDCILKGEYSDAFKKKRNCWLCDRASASSCKRIFAVVDTLRSQSWCNKAKTTGYSGTVLHMLLLECGVTSS